MTTKTCRYCYETKPEGYFVYRRPYCVDCWHSYELWTRVKQNAITRYDDEYPKERSKPRTEVAAVKPAE